MPLDYTHIYLLHFFLQSQVYGSIYKKYTEFYHALDFEDVNKKLVKLVREMNKLGDDIQVPYHKNVTIYLT